MNMPFDMSTMPSMSPEFIRAVASQPQHRKHHVGVACVFYDEYEVLLQKRTKKDGYGNLVLPGGTLDEDNPLQGIVRETREELGIDFNFARARMMPLWFDSGLHADGSAYLMLYFKAFAYFRGQERNMEPAKCAGFEWHQMGALPENMWANDRRAIEHHYYEISK